MAQAGMVGPEGVALSRDNKAVDCQTPPVSITEILDNSGKLSNPKGHESALDVPLPVTLFHDRFARSAEARDLSLRDLAGLIRDTAAGAKDSLPLLKLATFGTVATDKGSLRHDANLRAVSGLEGDYDGESVAPEEAAARMKAAGIGGVIYTSANHRPDAPRWRVLVPLARPASPAERDALADRLNTALGGILSPESRTRSQAFYFGGIAGQDAPAVHLIDGPALTPPPRTLDDDLADILGEIAAPEDDDDLLDMIEPDWDRIRSALRAIEDASDRHTWLQIGMALHHESRGSEEGFRLWCKWSRRCPEKYNEKDQRRTWRSFGKRNGQAVGIGTLYELAKGCGWTPVPSRLSFLSPADCEAAPARGYIVKGLFAPRDVACIFGAPGAGKSLLAPFLGYAVAQGREAWGMRTKAGGVFYVAAEDPTGMRGRVRALKMAHGDAPGFTLVEGVSDLLNPESPDLSALKAAAKTRRPALIFLDTLALSFPGLEENSAEGMGRVVAIARDLTAWGAAVVLIHHDTKDEGGTPRGHSLLNGALDVALWVKRDEAGIVRGRLTKNRNGPCDRDIAFRIGTEDGGTDEDGDTITLPVCAEMATDPFQVRLKPPERAVLRVLSGLVRAEDGKDSILLPESELREACAAPGIVSDADTRDSRIKAYRRALKGLTAQGVVSVTEDPLNGASRVFYRADSGIFDDAFDPGQAGQNPDKPDLSDRATGQGTRTDGRFPPLGGTPLSGPSGHPDK